MAEDQKDRYIQYLAEQNQDLRLTEKAMQLVLEDFMAKIQELEGKMSSIESNQAGLQKELAEKSKLCNSLKRQLKSTQEKLDYANQQLFGDKRQKVRKKTADGKPEKTDSVDNNQSQDIKGSAKSAKKERDLSNRPDGYKTMGVVGQADLKGIMSDGYNAYVFIGDELKSAQFKDTVHQVCMSHARNKFVKAANQGAEKNAASFSDDMKDLFENERRYNEAGLTPAERLKEIFAYLQDGDLPIDNNLAERTIRKLTTQRNNSYHYGSDAGAEMAATYHSIISTVKLHGSSAWAFIGTFFKKIFHGCRDYANMVPARIVLAASQC